jgi:hypothetical protein
MAPATQTHARRAPLLDGRRLPLPRQLDVGLYCASFGQVSDAASYEVPRAWDQGGIVYGAWAQQGWSNEQACASSQ